MAGRIVVMLLLVSGCIAEEAAPPGDDPDLCKVADPAIGSNACGSGPAVNLTGVPAPDLPLGRAWTYAVESFYEPALKETTIVVAEKDADGYLFAGATPADLPQEAVWSRGWHGTRDRGLDGDGFRMLDFPLSDGKTWDLREGFPVTARAADVQAPGGAEPGFVIEGAIESESGTPQMFRAEYAPSLGALTTMAYEVGDDRYFERLRLTGVKDVATYTWFERGPRAECNGYVDTPPTNVAEATPLDVPEGYDAVLVSAGGVGGRGGATGPGGVTWTGEGGATETWTTASFPATAGTWTASCAAGPDQWYFVALQAIRWIEADVGSGAAS